MDDGFERTVRANLGAIEAQRKARDPFEEVTSELRAPDSRGNVAVAFSTFADEFLARNAPGISRRTEWAPNAQAAWKRGYRFLRTGRLT